MASERQMSAVEAVKAKSRSLRGAIAEELVADHPGFSPTVAQLLKFHGVIQYSDRDRRQRRRHDGLEPHFEFTLRIRPTGGRLAAAQLLGVLEIVNRMKLDGPRITSRQGLQLGRLEKWQLKPVIRELAKLGLTTFASGGDVNCNVMCCPDPQGNTALSRQLHWIAEQIAISFMPDRGAYDELWLNEEPVDASHHAQRPIPIDPIYGPSYLPHKFKIGLAFPEDNCVDVFAQDVGLLAVAEGDRIVGFEMFIGGGLGMIPSVPRSFPALAQPFAFVPVQDLLEAIFAVMSVFRDFGNRERRSERRLKYLLAAWGLDTFREQVERRLRRPLQMPRGINVTGRSEHLGWRCSPDQLWSLGIAVESGRLGGLDRQQLCRALREILQRIDATVHLTPQQNLVLADVAPQDRSLVDSILSDHGVPALDAISTLRRTARACPALPCCRSAITEAERIVPEIVGELEQELAKLGLSEEQCVVCVTGCSCGCARSYLADIAIVGRTVDTRRGIEKFAIYVGGDRLGRRLNRLYRDLVPRTDVITSLQPLLCHFRSGRAPKETLGEFLNRVDLESLRQLRRDDSHPPIPRSHSQVKENQV